MGKSLTAGGPLSQQKDIELIPPLIQVPDVLAAVVARALVPPANALVTNVSPHFAFSSRLPHSSASSLIESQHAAFARKNPLTVLLQNATAEGLRALEDGGNETCMHKAPQELVGRYAG
ncbi:MAG: hypothetical protein Q9173_002883 [Seirophora scorigena]